MFIKQAKYLMQEKRCQLQAVSTLGEKKFRIKCVGQSCDGFVQPAIHVYVPQFFFDNNPPTVNKECVWSIVTRICQT